MCYGGCDGELMEECRYDKEDCEYKCCSPMDIDCWHSYSSTTKLAATSGLAAFLAAINL